ncbi:hypothetical protein [Denitromonas halophila]|uniref:Secretion system X translation initiation factor n=1 Tax=Denitromonas halophila TaxID=1629404 RepID=A0A557QH64_9RHOO|nr:hypothetical protein [Denitromonas halophila]TVO52246.1 hypothetical protein FHP91_17580 [Denitromonas halophila]
MNKRQLGLWGALAVTLAATWWASTVDPDDAPTTVRELRSAPTRTTRPIVTTKADLSALAAERPAFAAEAPSVFGVPAPPPSARQTARVAPPKLRAPTMPYTYAGSLIDADGARTLFLLDGERLVMARVGEVVGRYRIDAFDEHTVTLTYLPLKEIQRIHLATAP